MSRTFRRNSRDYEPDYVPGEFGPEDEKDIIGNLSVERSLKSNRDGKGDKPPSWYKKKAERKRRQARKRALRNQQDSPVEKKTNDWDWN